MVFSSKVPSGDRVPGVVVLDSACRCYRTGCFSGIAGPEGGRGGIAMLAFLMIVIVSILFVGAGTYEGDLARCLLHVATLCDFFTAIGLVSRLVVAHGGMQVLSLDDRGLMTK